MSREAALSFSPSVYNYGSDERLAYDQSWDRIIHFTSHGELRYATAEVVTNVPLPPSFSSMEDLKFGPDEEHMIFRMGSSSIWISCIEDFTAAVSEDNKDDMWGGAKGTGAARKLPLKWNDEPHFRVLEFFWMKQENRAGAEKEAGQQLEIVVVSTCGIEMFKIYADTKTLKSTRSFQILARKVWLDAHVR